MTKSAAEMEASMIAGFREKTGKTIEQWLAVAKKSGAEKHGALLTLLKSEHGLTHGYANMVALKHFRTDAGSMAESGTDLVAAQYAGDKAALKPVHDALARLIEGFGDDVEFAPKKAYVSVRRTKQFAIIQPSTKSRLDLGINLKGTAPKGRLEPSGSFNAMVTHRVRLESPAQVDAEIAGWLKAAYALA